MKSSGNLAAFRYGLVEALDGDSVEGGKIAIEDDALTAQHQNGA